MAEHTSTPNHSYPEMEPGTHFGEWADVLNDELIAILETETPVVDTAANRGTYNAYAGAIFIAQDTGEVSIGNGGDWTILPHGNTSHTETFVSDGDDVTRQIWVIESGANDPAGANDDDIILEKEA